MLDSILALRDAPVLKPMLQRMAQSWRNVSYEPAELEDYPWVDRERLEFYQREFAALGFEVLGDLSPRSEAGAEGFMRLMGHEKECAHVSLHASKIPLQAAQPLKCALTFSLIDGWTVAATDRERDAILSQLRLPKAVAINDCEATPAQLWRQTLKLRDQLMREKQLQSHGDSSAACWLEGVQRLNRERAALVEQKNPYQFALGRRALMRQAPPRRGLWLGQWTPQTPIELGD